VLIKLENANLKYMEGTPFEAVAIEDVSFELRKGEAIGIIGPTGSGKSSLGQVLTALIKPDSGTLTIDDKKVGAELQTGNVYKHVSFLFQKPEAQLFEANVFDEVAFGPRNLGLTEAKVEDSVKEALAIVDLDFKAYSRRSPFNLSGGEMRRVGIASVLALKSKAFVMDEPTAGLDAQSRRRIISFLKSLKGKDTSLVLISHDIDEVLEVCDSLIVLNEGRIVLKTAVKDVLKHASFMKGLGLNLPENYALASKLIDCGWAIKSLTKDSLMQALEKRMSG